MERQQRFIISCMIIIFLISCTGCFIATKAYKAIQAFEAEQKYFNKMLAERIEEEYNEQQLDIELNRQQINNVYDSFNGLDTLQEQVNKQFDLLIEAGYNVN